MLTTSFLNVELRVLQYAFVQFTVILCSFGHMQLSLPYHTLTLFQMGIAGDGIAMNDEGDDLKLRDRQLWCCRFNLDSACM